MPSNVVIKWIVDDSQLQRTTQRAKDAQKTTDDLRKSTKSYGQDVKVATDQGVKGFTDLKSIVASISFISLVAGLGAVAKRIFDIGVANQQTKISFEVMLGSAEKAKRVLADLTRFSIVTPFTPDQVNKAAKALLAFDIDAKKLIPTLKFLGDVSSGTGKDLTEMSIIFGQIRSATRLMGQDLLSLINAGFNPLQIISKETGRSMRDLKMDMEKGLISFDMVEKAFISATSEGGRFFNLMDRQSATIGGQLSTIEGNVEEVAKRLFEAREGGLSSFISGIAELTSNVDGLSKSFNELLTTVTAVPDFWLKMLNIIIEKTKTATIETDRLKREQLALQLALAKADLESNTETGLGNRLKILERILTLEKQLGLSNIVPLEDEVVGPGGTVKPASSGTKKARDLKAGEIVSLSLGSKTGTDFLKEIEQEIKAAVEISGPVPVQTKPIVLVSDWERAFEENKEAIKEAAFNSLEAIAQSSLSAELDEYSMRISALQDFYDTQIELAGDNERRKKELRIQESQEIKRLEKERLDAEKRAALASILVNFAVGIAKIWAGGGTYVDKIIRSAIVAAEGATQYAIANKARYYAKGDIDIKGPGSETSDSIPAMLSRGESVMTARQTREAFGILTDVRAGKLNDRVLKQIVNSGGTQFSDERIVDVLMKIESKRQPDLVRQGRQLIEVYTDRMGNKKRIRSKSI